MTKLTKVFILAAFAIGISGCPKGTGEGTDVPTTDTVAIDSIAVDTLVTE